MPRNTIAGKDSPVEKRKPQRAKLAPSPCHFGSHWGLLFALGILLIVLGCIGLRMVIGLTLVSMLFLGVLFVIAGFSQLVDVFQCRRWKPAFWYALIALLYIFGGFLIIYDPFVASALVTILLASIFMVIGLSRLMMAFSSKQTAGWGWLTFAGLIAIILGMIIMLQWPISGLWVIGLLIAVQLIIDGWAYLFIALAMRRQAHQKARS